MSTPDDVAVGELILTIEGSRLTGNLVPPKVTIAGVDHETSYGPNHYDLPAGSHRVRVWSPWMSGAGQAETTVEVVAGAATELFYSAPGFPGAPSRLGPTAHSRAGAKLVTAMLATLLVLFVLVLVGVLIWG